jgi:steroid delta-isomerase-like uncharacterized protein
VSIERTNEALLRRWFEEIWNRKQPELIAEFMDPDSVAHGMGPNGGDLHGPEAFRQVYEIFTGAFPDLHVTVLQSVAAGDKVALLLSCEATHAGDHLGVPATGKRVQFHVMTLARYREGKIVEGWNVIDLLAALRQIGAAPVGDALP